MKPATPILRNEHYLDVMTGGSASLPSPILREERYLAKLAGMEVNIPSPVTIKEKYYAKICGMDVDVPTYTRNMPRIYAYMAKAAGQTIEDLPTAVTREQRYWYDYVSEPPVTEHEYTGAVPYTFTANGEPLIDWSIYGNTVQNGTPSPDNPVMPQGTGERTAQLWNGAVFEDMMMSDGKYRSPATSSPRNVIYIPVIGGETYTFSIDELVSGTTLQSACSILKPEPNVSYKIDDQSTFVNHGQVTTFTRTMPQSANWFAIQIMSLDNLNNDIMINLGSTPLPYEQSGYKIPISSAGQTTPVYLGEVQTTRQIKKWVLTGEENVSVASAGIAVIVLSTPPVVGEECVCSHYIGTNVTAYSAIGAGECTTSIVASGGGNRLAINDVSLSTADAYKAFFAQQYTNGTPVCVWYVLETPQTAAVNEPLMKIGDYADEVSNVATIPTVNGTNTLSVETTVQPSEIYIKWKGAAT